MPAGVKIFFLLCSLLAGAAHAVEPTRCVYYEIFVRSFQDSDGDGIGDFQGVIQRLDYLQELGVTGIWLMPIQPSPSYHGYDVTNFKAVNPDYGTLDDFRELLRAAHQRGINVIIDLVVNHTSSEHPWFQAALARDPAYRNYYLWSETPRDWRGVSGAPAWHKSASGYYLGVFGSGMPDLNYRNPLVEQEMRGIARFWLEVGVDGFRIDAIQHVVESQDGDISNTPENLQWVKEFDSYIHLVKPEAFLVGETWTSTPTIVRYHQDAQLDMSFNFPLAEALLSAIEKRSPSNLRFALEQDEKLYPTTAVRGTFITNHDQVRSATALGFRKPDPLRERLAAGLLLTLPGTPFLYYGEEIGMPNGPGKGDEAKRTPMRWDATPGAGFTAGEPWYPFSSDDPKVSVAAQQEDPDSLLRWYRTLISLRMNHEALSRGTLELLDVGERSVLAFSRQAGEQVILVLANFSTKEHEFDLAPLKAAGSFDLVSGHGRRVGQFLTLPKSTMVILLLP